ncbi:hypothetical protein HZS61_017809 [Fusarium oxysporum f. sp. conglutinans]|uniref:Rhodopsin domain-containing protein n=1 Tax=Fusarium oxysporum f. sp. conglutinans TaxID=100902 RepID=A0A8H6GLK2_FUSOX|nr:hypothetical protein HZS61_017809 [Fusarium oxysporum f. sp. conglutinans]
MPQIEDRPSFIIESWTLYVFGTLILFSRFAVRFKTVGWRGLQGDDFFSVLVLIFYAVDAFTVHLIYYLGTNIEAGVAAKTHTLTKDEINEYETGSKLELAAWVVPDPGEKCSFKMQNFLVTTVLNVLTDALILGIPMPLLWKLQVPFRKSVSPPLPKSAL